MACFIQCNDSAPDEIAGTTIVWCACSMYNVMYAHLIPSPFKWNRLYKANNNRMSLLRGWLEPMCVHVVLVKELVSAGLEEGDTHLLSCGLLLARQASLEGAHLFPSYQCWLHVCLLSHIRSSVIVG